MSSRISNWIFSDVMYGAPQYKFGLGWLETAESISSAVARAKASRLARSGCPRFAKLTWVFSLAQQRSPGESWRRCTIEE
jgi:hypothetical protein